MYIDAMARSPFSQHDGIRRVHDRLFSVFQHLSLLMIDHFNILFVQVFFNTFGVT